MKALSIRQPWAWAILYAQKRIENRSRADGRMPAMCSYRGPLLIHASAGMTVDEFTTARDFMLDRKLLRVSLPYRQDLPRGGIVGVCTVVGHVEPTLPDGAPSVYRGTSNARDPNPGEDLRWHELGSYGLVFAKDVTPLPMAVPWKGALGLFDVRAEDVLALPSSVSPPEATHALAEIIRQHGG